jgi:leader peptidase (prepilin peptidase)/N-methyltransferase
MTTRVVLLTVLGGCAGGVLASYWGVVVDRGWAGSLAGRSRCDACASTLRWFELVPIASFLALRGRCRRCNAVLPRALLVRETAGVAIGLAAGAIVGVLVSR